jgi:hypothetical protein
MAFMLHAPAGVTDAEFFDAIKARRPDLAAVTQSIDAGLRVGTRHPRDHELASRRDTSYEPIEAAVEVTMPEDGLAGLLAEAGSIGGLVVDIAHTERSIVTVGPMHRIVEPRPGDVFLSLTFQREPGTTLEELHQWWINQHAVLATRYLPEVLAYDQVHVDHQLSEQASRDAGFAYRCYDSYDNVTWANYDEFVKSVSKPGVLEVMRQDDDGHIGQNTRVGALMSPVE